MSTACRASSATWSLRPVAQTGWPAAIDPWTVSVQLFPPASFRRGFPQTAAGLPPGEDLLERLNVGRVGSLAPDQHGLDSVFARRQATNREPLAFRKRRQHASGQQRDAHAGRDAA